MERSSPRLPARPRQLVRRRRLKTKHGALSKLSAPKLATVDFGGNAGIAGAEARAQILEAAGPAVAIVC